MVSLVLVSGEKVTVDDTVGCAVDGGLCSAADTWYRVQQQRSERKMTLPCTS